MGSDPPGLTPYAALALPSYPAEADGVNEDLVS